MNFIAMDFETANYQKHSACSLALVMVRNSQIVDEYYTLIKPETDFSGKISKFMVYDQMMFSMPLNFLIFGNRLLVFIIKTV